MKFSELENALNQALDSAKSLGASAEESIVKPSPEAIADIPAELLHDIAAITFGEQPVGEGWKEFQEDNGVRRFVATHIHRA